MSVPASVYFDVQQRMIAIMESLDPETFDRRVPACPAWTIRDLLAHVAAGISDSASGNVPELEGVNLMDHWRSIAAHDALEAMLRRQIEQRRAHSVDELLEEWRTAARHAEPLLRGQQEFPAQVPVFMDWRIAMDITVHEDDLRGALGLEPADPTLPCYAHAATWYGMALELRIRDLNRPAVRLEADSVALDLGDGEPAAVLRAGAYEMTMALTGRRTDDEIRALDWDGDPEPFLDIFSSYMSPS